MAFLRQDRHFTKRQRFSNHSEVQSVYLETTIPSYLAARASKNVAVSLRQKITHDWWEKEKFRFYVYSSIFVNDEASAGDRSAAKRRLSFLKDIPELPVTSAVLPLAKDLAILLQLPEKALLDAAHLAMAISHRMDYMLTWNCTHLANPVLQRKLLEYCHYHSLHVPVICTPEHLINL